MKTAIDKSSNYLLTQQQDQLNMNTTITSVASTAVTSTKSPVTISIDNANNILVSPTALTTVSISSASSSLSASPNVSMDAATHVNLVDDEEDERDPLALSSTEAQTPPLTAEPTQQQAACTAKNVRHTHSLRRQIPKTASCVTTTTTTTISSLNSSPINRTCSSRRIQQQQQAKAAAAAAAAAAAMATATTTSAAPLTATTQASTMREVLASIPGFSVKPRRRSNKKMSTAAQIEQTKDGKIDLETPDSILTATNLRDLLNKQTFSMLKPLYQYNLIQLLPSVDREAIEMEQKMSLSGSTPPPIRLTSSSLNNEFFARACLEWRERLSEGEFTPENQMRLRTEAEREKNKLDPWKLKHFEPLWGEKSAAATRITSSTFIRNNSSSSGCSSSSSAHVKEDQQDREEKCSVMEMQAVKMEVDNEVKNENVEETCDTKDTITKIEICATTTRTTTNSVSETITITNAEKRSIKRSLTCSPAKRRKTNSGGSEQLFTETIDLIVNVNAEGNNAVDTIVDAVDSTQQQYVPEIVSKTSEKRTDDEDKRENDKNKSDKLILESVKEEQMQEQMVMEEVVLLEEHKEEEEEEAEDVTKAQLETDNVQIADNIQKQQEQETLSLVEEAQVNNDISTTTTTTIITTTTTSILMKNKLKTTTTTPTIATTTTTSNTCDNIVCTPTLVTPISNNNNNNNNNSNSNSNSSNNGTSSDIGNNGSVTNTTVSEILPDLELAHQMDVSEIEDDEIIAQQFADAENYVLESVGVVKNDNTGKIFIKYKLQLVSNTETLF